MSIHDLDFVIIGGGPAGIQLAYFLNKSGVRYAILEQRDCAGSFFQQFPRHRKFISINKVNTGYDCPKTKLRYDWNSLLCDSDFSFREYTDDYFPNAEDYVQYLNDYVDQFDINILYQHKVTGIKKRGQGFEISVNEKELFSCDALIVATGMQQAFIPDIPGIEHTENYTSCSINPNDFINQRVLIVGKGNSAFETANHLGSATRVTHIISPNSIKMAWKTHFFGHLRAVNNDFLDTYILKGQNSILDAQINKIVKEGDELVVDLTFSHAQEQKATLAYDRIILCTGFRWQELPFEDDCKPERIINDKFPKMTSSWESSNIPHLYYAGTLTQARDFHKTMSSVIHGFRYNAKALANILLHRYRNRPPPSINFELDCQEITQKIINRVSSSAALMHQPGFLGDLLVFDGDTGAAHYYEDMSIDFIADELSDKYEHYCIISMEYGEADGDILAVNRVPNPEKAYDDFYLHPIVRYYSYGKVKNRFHMAEHLENDWRVGKHPGQKPLIRSLSYIGCDNPEKFDNHNQELLYNYLQEQVLSTITSPMTKNKNLS